MTQRRCVNIFKNNDELSDIAYDLLVQELLKHQFTYTLTYSPDAELNICIGGDGSFLRAVNQTNFSEIPFVGINTGRLGFYQEITPSTISKFFSKYLKGEYQIDFLSVLHSFVKTHSLDHNFSIYSLNEIVIKSSSASLIHLNVCVDEVELEHFAGDGLILSTPAGSTAYNLSAGGSILYQTLKGYQLTPLAPINSKYYRSLNRSLVLPEDSTMLIKPLDQNHSNFSIISDGIEHETQGDFAALIVCPGKKKIKKLVFDKNWYWENIKEKFL